MTAPLLNAAIQGQGTISADNLNTYIQNCTNIAQLRSFIGLPGMCVFIDGSVVQGDGGAGPFYWNTTSTGPDNDSTVIVPQPGVPGAWVRLTISETSAVNSENIAALQALDGGLTIPVVYVEGYYSAGDGGGGFYIYNPTDTTSPSNGGTIIIDAQNHRYYLSTTSIISVKQFGATGNGVTSDSAAINAAISIGSVWFPQGTYLVSSPILVTGTGISLHLENNSIILRGFDGDSLVKISGSFNTVVGGQFNSLNGTYTSGSNGGIYITGFSNIIRGCYIHNTAYGAVGIDGGAGGTNGTYNKVFSCYIENNTNIGILNSNATGSIIDGNYITACGGEGITLDNATIESIVNGNTIIANGTIGAFGGIGAGDKSNDNVISNNYIGFTVNAGGIGINGDRNLMIGNQIRNNGGPGVLIGSNVSYPTPTQNMIVSNICAGNTTTFTNTSGCTDTTIIGNIEFGTGISDSGTGTVYMSAGGSGFGFGSGPPGNARIYSVAPSTLNWAVAGDNPAKTATSGLWCNSSGDIELHITNSAGVIAQSLTSTAGGYSRLGIANTTAIALQASSTPMNIGDMTIQLTSNTSITIKAMGSDSVVRSTTLTIS